MFGRQARGQQRACLPPPAVNYLGLNTAPAKNWQSCLNAWGFNTGTVDGVVGSNTVTAPQKFLNAVGENAGTPDGIAGPQTRAHRVPRTRPMT
ncbi:peptidoglycan-binding protein [Streptomyces canus]|uniref:peptidoglycan-binding domain-containing protein n=1 Tax=Streptomyces canus TaxID=58343 RepID=UPI00216AD0FC|nr:peptidoglycan-binding domain-containing protein [Streptomyces canus]